MTISGHTVDDSSFAHVDEDVCEYDGGWCTHSCSFDLMEELTIEFEVVVRHDDGEDSEDVLLKIDGEEVSVLVERHESFHHEETLGGVDVGEE